MNFVLKIICSLFPKDLFLLTYLRLGNVSAPAGPFYSLTEKSLVVTTLFLQEKLNVILLA